MRVLAIFQDDSSLYAVSNFVHDVVEDFQWTAEFAFSGTRELLSEKLSSRQLAEILGSRQVDHVLSEHDLTKPEFLQNYEIVVSSRYPKAFRLKWALNLWNFKGDRPCFVGLFNGLELFPEKGFLNRKFCDVLCLNNWHDLSLYRNGEEKTLPCHHQAIVYSPLICDRRPGEFPMAQKTLNSRKTLVFFAQAISPATYNGRLDVLKTLCLFKRAQPDWDVIIKLRSHKYENRKHVHREKFPYEDLLKKLPDNFPEKDEIKTVVMSMAEALERADFFVTCTSTAGFEALAKGMPGVFLLDYKENNKDILSKRWVDIYFDPAIAGMKADFEKTSFVDTVRFPSISWKRKFLPTAESRDHLYQAITDFYLNNLSKKPLRTQSFRDTCRIVFAENKRMITGFIKRNLKSLKTVSKMN